jgi:alkanesulfonate monooxygenase SsuD/methylene tetrahydromethanopterin reductase-like flavin-dependent oxidoreductase (luciferase family)
MIRITSYSYDHVEVLLKPSQAPHPGVVAASSKAATDWAAANGFSILMDPHSSGVDLIRKRRHHGKKLVARGPSDTGPHHPHGRSHRHR